MRMSRNGAAYGSTVAIFLALSCGSGLAGETGIRTPMSAELSRTTTYRWLGKVVRKARPLDGMEELTRWTLENTGQAQGTVWLARAPVLQGMSSLKLECPTNGTDPLPHGRYFGFARLKRLVSGENWDQWNRLSFWVYPDMLGHKNISLLTILHNDGPNRVPDHYGKMGLNYVLLRNRQWNHVVWEIANLPRDKVTAFELQYRMQGHEPGSSDRATFYFDRLELQQVDADHFEGWNVASGKIAYSHIGYLRNLPKLAFAGPLDASEFRVIDENTGQVAFMGPIKNERTINGSFAVMDFTELRTAGEYTLRAGSLRTRSFEIGDSVWDSTIRSVLNFFYAERCGTRIPGIHDVCHRDWLGRRNGNSIVINGGWHDAGDLSQGLKNTSQGTYALFALAERLKREKRDSALQERLIEEARWGLDWVLKTRFGDGSRITWATLDRWTNGIIGDADDMVADAHVSASGSFMAVAAEAIAARVLRKVDPDLASLSLKTAQQDWEDGLGFLEEDPQWHRQDLELVSLASHAALELYKTVFDQQYARKAISWARIIRSCQQREILPGLDEPITGFFYASPAKQRILRYEHTSEQQAPVRVLYELCRLFPGHPDWMDWYSSLALYSKYYVQEMARFSAPYQMLASALHRDDDHTRIAKERIFPGANPEEYLEQVVNGVKVGSHHYVRRFPVWFVFRGNNGTLLSEALGLALAASLRRDKSALSLVQDQLMWVIGRNPFSQSMMFGVGHEYAPQYAAMLGDQVGATAVGIQTRHERDIPYWPAENCHNWKETWLHPAIRWLEILGYLEVFESGQPRNEEGGLRIGKVRKTSERGEVEVSVSVAGSGDHRLEVLAENLELERRTLGISLRDGEPGDLRVRATVLNERTPWIMLLVPDARFEGRIEITGF